MNRQKKPLNKAIQAIRDNIRFGSTIMVGGFGRGGTPFTLLEALADSDSEISNLTVIKNDASEPDLGVGPLFKSHKANSLISTHIGLNPDLIERMNRGEIDVEFYPQGIFAERIRAAGAGIPAFLTDIGIGTPVAENKKRVELKGREYLVEEALHADTALIYVDRIDEVGNMKWKGSNRNMNMIMAMACTRVVAEADRILEAGAIAPEDVQLPGLFVDVIVESKPRRHMHKKDGS